MRVENEFELIALHKAFFELKFKPNSLSRDIVVSPIIAQLSNRVLESLIELYEATDRSSVAQDWRDWRASLHDRVAEQQVVKSNLERIKDLWVNYSEQDKIETVNDLVAPFFVSKTLLSEFIEYVDQSIADTPP